MLIAINLLPVVTSIGGAYNYVYNLLNALEEHSTENIYILYYTKANEELVKHFNHFELIRCNVDANNRIKRVLYENTYFLLKIWQRKVDFVIWPCDTMAFFKTRKTIVISHDFLPIIKPKSYNWLKRTYLHCFLKNTISKVDNYIFISNTTQNELGQIRANLNFEKTTILPNIIPDVFKPLSKEVIDYTKAKYNIPDNFFLYISHYYPHKNHLRLLDAYAKFVQCQETSESKYSLVLRGDNLIGNIEIRNFVRKNNLEEKVIFLPRLSEEEVIHLYNLASTLVFPSLYEGGGIPVMEAMACGCPILASKIPAVEEFTKDASVLFNPFESSEIFQVLRNFSKGYYDINQMKTKGLERVQLQRANYITAKFEDFLKNANKNNK